MAQICTPVVALIMLCVIGLFSNEAAAARRVGCCLKYTQMRVPRNAIKGFTIQTNQGKCNMNAVILHTLKGNNICVDPYQPWVTDVIDKLKAQIQVLRAKHRNAQ